MNRILWGFFACALISACLFETSQPEIADVGQNNNPNPSSEFGNDTTVSSKNGGIQKEDSIWVVDTMWEDHGYSAIYITSNHYDSLNRLISDTTFVPNPITHVLQQIDSRKYLYDESGLLSSIQYSTGRVAKFEYGTNRKPKIENIYSNPTLSGDTKQNIFEYDSRDSLIQTVSRKTSLSSSSDLDTITVTTYIYDMKRIREDDKTYTYSYNNGIAIASVQNEALYYKYDEKNRLSFTYFSSTGSASNHHWEEYYYNSNDLLEKTIWSPIYKSITTTYKWKKVKNGSSVPAIFGN